MKRFIKEIILLIIQLLVFYILPLTSLSSDPLGMVMLILVLTLIVSIIIGYLSKEKIKYLYPVIVSIMFIPTVFIYYNNSAIIHSLWYLIDSIIGVLIGMVLSHIIK